VFNVFALLLDDTLKPATPLSYGAFTVQDNNWVVVRSDKCYCNFVPDSDGERIL